MCSLQIVRPNSTNGAVQEDICQFATAGQAGAADHFMCLLSESFQ